MFQRLDFLHEFGIVLEEAPFAHPVLAYSAFDEGLTNQDFARQFRVARPVMHAPLGVQHQAMQSDALPGHDLPRPFLPVRLINMPADQVAADLLQPLRLDLRNAAGEQSRGFHQFGGNDPATGFLQQRRSGMNVEADAARTEIILVLLADQAYVAEQAGQQSLVNGLVTRRDLILFPSMLVAKGHQLTMNIAPLAQTKPVDEVLPAPLTLLVAGLVLPDFVAGGPELQVGQEFRFFVLPLGVRLVGGPRVLLWPVAAILGAQGGGDDQYLTQATVLARGEDHAADLRIERQFGQFETDLGQFLARLVDGTEFGEQLVAISDHSRQRRFEKGKVLDIAQVQRLHAQDDASEAGTQNLGFGIGRSLVEIFLVVELEADAGRHPAAAPRALGGRRAGDRLDLQSLDLAAMRIALDACQPRVDHVADAGHGQRRLGDVGRQHHAASLMGSENTPLLDRGLPRKQRQHFKPRREFAK